MPDQIHDTTIPLMGSEVDPDELPELPELPDELIDELLAGAKTPQKITHPATYLHVST